ncbi:hypothetical protein P5673_010233 [Acropora cervicornis]|uniref:Uncharacterized protein n=1 Tax=Acropora cervicornis TaxID=6130 RepID=A0AAD9QRR9_ACRCE|nr:hypothetical protein P5673_010233 [Acropora cervicornis]
MIILIKKIQGCYGKHLAAFSKDIINDDSNKYLFTCLIRFAKHHFKRNPCLNGSSFSTVKEHFPI